MCECVLCVCIQNESSQNLLQMTWLRIEQFLPDFMKQLFPTVPPPAASTSPQDPPSLPPPPPAAPDSHPHHTHPSSDYHLEGAVIHEVPVTMTVDRATGGVVTMAERPIQQAQCSPSRSPPGNSPHASPPTSSSPGESEGSCPLEPLSILWY